MTAHTTENEKCIMKLALIVNNIEIKVGTYKHEQNKILIILNEFVQYAFDLKSKNQYWVLKALYTLC